MIGFNFRMTEIEAAIGIEQLKKLPGCSPGQRCRAPDRACAASRGWACQWLPIARTPTMSIPC